MDWNWLPDRAGYIADGRKNAYLIIVDVDQHDRVTGVRLTRWQARFNALPYETALEVGRNTIIIPLDPPRRLPGRSALSALEEARHLADAYESGQMLTNHPAWQHPPAHAAGR